MIIDLKSFQKFKDNLIFIKFSTFKRALYSLSHILYRKSFDYW